MLIGEHCNTTLKRLVFIPTAARQIVELLNVLHTIKSEMNEEGRLSEEGLRLRQLYFRGERAKFSDESESRKKKKNMFVFPDPASGGTIECTWHGKVSSSFLRLYFDWPVKRPEIPLRVAYIGAHI